MNLRDYEMEIICMHDCMLPPDESTGTPVAPTSTDGRSDGIHLESIGTPVAPMSPGSDGNMAYVGHSIPTAISQQSVTRHRALRLLLSP